MAQMIIGGEQVDGTKVTEVVSPFDNTVIDTVPAATDEEVDRALAVAEQGAKRLRKTTGYERFCWLKRATVLMAERAEEFVRTISQEEGKPLAEARVEVARAITTIELAAEEAKRISGQGIPLDGTEGAGNKLGFTLRVPCGVVVAITPFNFPLNLVTHKVGPGLAAGNSVIIKPASDTPLTAIKFTALLLEAGVPADAIQCLTGSGAKLGKALCSDRRVRKISFTGSYDVGEVICRTAGVKKVTMELGSNSPLIVMDDADLEKVAGATLATAYPNAGQVCISCQRVFVDRRVYGDFLDILTPKVQALTVGDPFAAETKIGPLVRSAEAERVVSWIREAVDQGARLLTGGEQEWRRRPAGSGGRRQSRHEGLTRGALRARRRRGSLR